jgi:hypothetical protein
MFSLPYRLGPMLLASALAGQAITYNRGAYAEPAVLCVVLGLFVIASQFAGAFGREPRVAGDSKLTVTLLWIALFAMWWTTVSDPAIVVYAYRPWEFGRKLQWYSLVLLATYLPWLNGRWREPRLLAWSRFAGICTFVALAGIDTFYSSFQPYIDVWAIQMQAAAALLDGRNPFTSVAALDTGPGTLTQGVPFVYPPTQIYVTALAWRFLGDVRYTMLAAVLIVGLAMRFMARGTNLPSLAKDAPALFLVYSPKLFFVLALGLACAQSGRSTLAAVAFGVASSSKQTMFWLPPLAGFCLGFRPAQWIVMVLAAILPPLPFAIWDFKALKHANFDVLNGLPDRVDSLTINNWVHTNLQFDIPGSVGFALAALVVALACWRLRGVTQCAVAIATTYYAFFAFNRWAFANYYFLIAGLAALAAAASNSTMRSITTALPAPSPEEPRSGNQTNLIFRLASAHIRSSNNPCRKREMLVSP